MRCSQDFVVGFDLEGPTTDIKRAEIEIEAPASTVWETLTDFEDYGWSSSFKGGHACTRVADKRVTGRKNSITQAGWEKCSCLTWAREFTVGWKSAFADGDL